jgi:Na+-driven multidrug efflux pump
VPLYLSDTQRSLLRRQHGVDSTARKLSESLAQSPRWVLLVSNVKKSTSIIRSIFIATGTIMVSSEWWAWEGVSLSVSMLGPVALAVNSILLSFSSILFQIPQSMGIATAVRVGNLLGAGRPYEARLAAILALILSIITSVFNRSVVASQC